MPKTAKKNIITLAFISTLIITPLCLTSTAAEIGEIEQALDGQNSLSEIELDQERAKGATEWLSINELDMDANMNNNIVNSSTSGNNTVSNDSFSNSSGFATVIQNSGNHVIIQNSTIVNLTVEK